MKRTLGTRAVTRGLAKIEPSSSDTLVAFAAKAGSVASDGDGPNSPFTAAMLKHIASPGLDLRLAFGKVRDEVIKTTGNRQEPFVYGSLGGSTVSLVPGLEKPPAEIGQADRRESSRTRLLGDDQEQKRTPSCFRPISTVTQRALLQTLRRSFCSNRRPPRCSRRTSSNRMTVSNSAIPPCSGKCGSGSMN